MAPPDAPPPYDIDREYRARVPFMLVGALVFGAGGGLIGIQFVLGLGFGLVSFAIFGVAVVILCATISGTAGAFVGLIVYGIVPKVTTIGSRPAQKQPRADPVEAEDLAGEQAPSQQESPALGLEHQTRLAAELDAFAKNLALRQARGEMPPPNLGSEVPYAQVASEWLAARVPERVFPDYREANPGDNERRFVLLKDRWPNIAEEGSESPPIKPLITRAFPLAASGNVIVIGFDVKDAFLRDAAERRLVAFTEVIARGLGEPVAVVFQTVDPTHDQLDDSRVP